MRALRRVIFTSGHQRDVKRFLNLSRVLTDRQRERAFADLEQIELLTGLQHFVLHFRFGAIVSIDDIAAFEQVFGLLAVLNLAARDTLVEDDVNARGAVSRSLEKDVAGFDSIVAEVVNFRASNIGGELLELLADVLE